MIKKELWCMEIDSTNWREEWMNYTSNKKELELLENGAKSLSQSWYLQVMYNRWKKMKGYKEPPQPDCSSSYGDWEQSIKKYTT
tara:strand:- start:245 stop:496 length:252 start_codon:yes stop_codon:yes gene_type:complete